MTIEYKDSKRIVGLSTDFQTSGLKAYWKMNESSGNLLNTASAQNSDSTMSADLVSSGTVNRGTAGHVSGVDSIGFPTYDADGNKVTANNSASDYGFMNKAAAKFTLCFWAKNESYNSTVDLWGFGGNGSGTDIMFRNKSSGFTIWLSGTEYTSFTHNVGDNNWHFYMLSWDEDGGSNNVQFQLDGTKQTATVTTSNTSDASNPLIIGDVSGNEPEMDIQEFSLWNRVLTDAEIALIYNSGNGAELQNTTIVGSKPTDVQDNSILVEKDTARRYWFDAESTSDVTWNDSTDVGCSISGNTITKTASNGWTSGIGQTDQQVSASDGGTITITSNATNSFVGLSNVTSLNQQAKTWFDIKFGFSDEEIIENGAQITPDTAFSRATSDTMKITISSSGLVKYFVNDSLKHTSTITASGSYFGIFAAYTQNENMTATITTPASWTMQPTYEDNFSTNKGWVTQYASKMAYNATTKKLDPVKFENSNNGDNITIAKELDFTLGTKFVMRFVLDFSQFGNSPFMTMGVSDKDSTVNADTAQDYLGIVCHNGSTWSAQVKDNTELGTFTNVSQASYSGHQSNFGTDFYCELIRNEDSFTINIRTGSHTGTSVVTATTTISTIGTVSNLKYIKFGSYDGTSAAGYCTTTIDDLLVYNGVTSIN
jgi:hypothetical protein